MLIITSWEHPKRCSSQKGVQSPVWEHKSLNNTRAASCNGVIDDGDAVITTPPAMPGTGPIAKSHVQMHGSNVPNNMQEDVVAFNAVSATMFDNDRLRYGCFAAWETHS